MEMLRSQVLMATLDEFQPHQISLKSSVIMEDQRARILCRYLCGTDIPDKTHIVYDIRVHDSKGEMHHVRAFIEFGATGISMAPQFLKRPGI